MFRIPKYSILAFVGLSMLTAFAIHHYFAKKFAPVTEMPSLSRTHLVYLKNNDDLAREPSSEKNDCVSEEENSSAHHSRHKHRAKEAPCDRESASSY